METNLFSDDVVLIIGAGASVPFGLPTGLDLIDLVHKQTKFEFEKINSHNGYNSMDVPISTLASVHGNPFTSGMPAHEWINAQASDSIDDLIRHNPQKAKFLRCCIVLELLRTTTRTNMISDSYINRWEVLEADNFCSRKFPLVINGEKILDKKNQPVMLRNWVHNLINIVREQVTLGLREEGQKIKIISFNYDGILEYILEKMWTDSEVIDLHWTEYFNIVHPHDRLDIITKPLLKSDISGYIRGNFDNIAVIHDNDAGLHADIVAWRSEAKKIMANVKKIYSLGFAFAKSNCQNILGITKDWCVSGKEIHFLNFDDNFGLRSRVEYYRGFPEGRLVEMKPLKGDYLQITDALMGGFLGEMPS